MKNADWTQHSCVCEEKLGMNVQQLSDAVVSIKFSLTEAGKPRNSISGPLTGDHLTDQVTWCWGGGSDSLWDSLRLLI